MPWMNRTIIKFILWYDYRPKYDLHNIDKLKKYSCKEKESIAIQKYNKSFQIYILWWRFHPAAIAPQKEGEGKSKLIDKQRARKHYLAPSWQVYEIQNVVK